MTRARAPRTSANTACISGVARVCGKVAGGRSPGQLSCLLGHEVEVGADARAEVGFEVCRLGRLRLEDGPKRARAFVGEGVEHLLLGAEVVVEGADREAACGG